MQTQPEVLWPGGPVFYQAEYARLTTDTVLLADFAAVQGRQKGADLGCASGALMLLLLWREQGLHMTGLELNPDAAALAVENLRQNGLFSRGSILCGDMRQTVQNLRNGSFDFVISNPPYYEPSRGPCPDHPERASARTELGCSLDGVCRVASRLCRSGGKVFLSYRAEGLTRLLETMSRSHLEPKRLRFVHHSPDKAASLVLAEGRKDGNPGLVTEAPLLLHTADGNETGEYRKILHLDG